MERYQVRLTEQAELDLARIYGFVRKNPHLLPSPTITSPASRPLWMGLRHFLNGAAFVIMSGRVCASSVLSVA